MTHSPTTAMLMGALVADAACLGLHWLYDPDRIAEIAARQGDRTAFTPVDAANFAETKGYFAHAERRDGKRTQYGEVLHLAIRSLVAQGGRFDGAAYSALFAAHFGPGGGYRGYIDRPTRGALANIAAETTPSGIDDDQLPAVATLPALMAAYPPGPDRNAGLRAAREITNVNPVAEAYGTAYADLLGRVMAGEALDQALRAAAEGRDDLKAAVESPEACSVAYGAITGRACHLPMAGPLSFHILARSQSFTEATERNIRAGGDSAGRSILIGAVMGRVHGIGTPQGIPIPWLLALDQGSALWSDCAALGG